MLKKEIRVINSENSNYNDNSLQNGFQSAGRRQRPINQDSDSKHSRHSSKSKVGLKKNLITESDTKKSIEASARSSAASKKDKMSVLN